MAAKHTRSLATSEVKGESSIPVHYLQTPFTQIILHNVDSVTTKTPFAGPVSTSIGNLWQSIMMCTLMRILKREGSIYLQIQKPIENLSSEETAKEKVERHCAEHSKPKPA